MERFHLLLVCIVNIGVFYQLIAGKCSSERLQEIINYLNTNPQTEDIKKVIRVFKKWGKDNGYNFTDQPINYENNY